jgi:hypothetical protein
MDRGFPYFLFYGLHQATQYENNNLRTTLLEPWQVKVDLLVLVPLALTCLS